MDISALPPRFLLSKNKVRSTIKECAPISSLAPEKIVYNDRFCEHYHKRSNAETSVMMVKTKFGDFVRSKTWTAQINEVLCKIICHNICVVIQEMHELGINPNFCVESQGSVYKVG